MSNKLVLAWKNPSTRIWTPVGILNYEKNKYSFYYTNGANVEHFRPFGNMKDISKTYVSDILFPIFTNRLLSKSRPEYEDYLNWLGIDKNNNSEMLELSRSRGIRATDELQLFPIPQQTDSNMYEVYFFSHGISHMSPSYHKRLNNLQKGEQLLILKDIQNEFDQNALVLRTKDDPVELVGYCPSFFVQDFNELLKKNNFNNIAVTVEKINLDAPLQLKLLCKFSTKWPENFKPFSNNNFQAYQNNL